MLTCSNIPKFDEVKTAEDQPAQCRREKAPLKDLAPSEIKSQSASPSPSLPSPLLDIGEK